MLLLTFPGKSIISFSPSSLWDAISTTGYTGMCINHCSHRTHFGSRHTVALSFNYRTHTVIPVLVTTVNKGHPSHVAKIFAVPTIWMHLLLSLIKGHLSNVATMSWQIGGFIREGLLYTYATVIRGGYTLNLHVALSLLSPASPGRYMLIYHCCRSHKHLGST